MQDIKSNDKIIKEDSLLTVSDVAKILKVNVHKVYDLIRAGILPALKLGSLKIRRESLNKFLRDYDGMNLDDLNNIIAINYDSNLIAHDTPTARKT